MSHDLNMQAMFLMIRNSSFLSKKKEIARSHVNCAHMDMFSHK
jgi:hypothetical protein